MTDITAAIGLVQLSRYPSLLKRRWEMIGRYNDAFKNAHLYTLQHQKAADTCSNGHLYVTRLIGRTLEKRNAIIVRMAERGIACNVHFKPLPMMTAYRTMGFDIKDYPHSFDMFQNELTLPLHTRLTDDMIDYVSSNFLEIIQ